MTNNFWLEMHGQLEYRWEISIPRSTLLKALKTIEWFPQKIPPDADIFMRVPGGGDWSNEDLSVDEEDTDLFLKVKFCIKDRHLKEFNESFRR